MTRLAHSTGGFVRSLQMSSVRVFGFVEGRLDRPFFDRVLSQVCTPASIGHRVYAMKELPEATGGKAALISKFKQFRRDGLLACTAFGKTMVCIFFADKDADDFTRTRLRSPHLIYTPTYDLEGHLFTSGDLTRALADACGITNEQARRLVPQPMTWLRSAATNWKDWIALCLVSHATGVNCGCTFDRVSQVNPDALAAPDVSHIAAFKVRLANAIGIPLDQLEARFELASRTVAVSISNGQPLRYFKGKWLSHVMQRYLEGQARIPDAQISGVGDRMGVTLVAQTAQNASCNLSAAYRSGIQAVVSQL